MNFVERFLVTAGLTALILYLPPYIEQQFAPEPAPHVQPLPSPAPIWSSRCEREGRTFIAQRADDKPWTVECTGPRTRA